MTLGLTEHFFLRYAYKHASVHASLQYADRDTFLSEGHTKSFDRSSTATLSPFMQQQVSGPPATLDSLPFVLKGGMGLSPQLGKLCDVVLYLAL